MDAYGRVIETARYPINPLNPDYWPAAHATAAKAASQLAPNPSHMLIPSVLNEFKEAVADSRLTKAGLIEILKMLCVNCIRENPMSYTLCAGCANWVVRFFFSRFPKLSKPLIKDTLTRIAVRKGDRGSEKRWVLIEGS